MVPCAQAATAIARLREIGDRIDRHLSATEIRSMAGDGLWLSPSFGDDRVSIHFSWLRESDAVAALTAEIRRAVAAARRAAALGEDHSCARGRTRTALSEPACVS